MNRGFTKITGVILFLIGLIGFFNPALGNVIQLDLFQNLIYVVFGAIGLKLGFGNTTSSARARYARACGVLGLSLLLFGLSFPNFFDIFHLEPAEHVFHGLLGLAGCLTGQRGSHSVQS